MLVIYLILTVLTFVIGSRVYETMMSNLGNSIEMNTLIEGFNRTTLFDMFNAQEGITNQVFNPIKWVLPIYLLVSILLNGGLLANVVKAETSINDFFRNGIKFVVPFAGISAILILLVVLWSIIVFLPYGLILGDPIADYKTEIPFLYSLLVIVVIWMVGVATLWCWAIASKIHLIHSQNFFTSLKSGFTSLKASILKMLGWTLLVILLNVLLLIVSLLLNKMNSASTWLMTILTFILMQIVIFKKIGLKAFAYAGITHIIKD